MKAEMIYLVFDDGDFVEAFETLKGAEQFISIRTCPDYCEVVETPLLKEDKQKPQEAYYAPFEIFGY